MALLRRYTLRPLQDGEHAACERILRELPEWFGIEEAIRAIADGKMPVYILDQDYKLIRTLKPGDPSPIMIDPNEFFIVGSYLMRFHQEKPQAMMTSDATQLRRAGAMTAR